MNGQRGVIAMIYLIIAGGIALTILGLGVAVKVQSSRLESCKTGFEAFKAQVKAEGEAAAKEAARVNLANQKAKEQTDAKTKQLLADNSSLGKRLRDARANGGFLPKPAPGAGSAATVIRFNRDDLERALQFLDAGVSEIVTESDGFRLRLATSAEWAASVGTR